VQIVKRLGSRMVIPRPESAQHLWHPSVELLAQSASEHYAPGNILAVMLTGMGHDGAEAFAKIHQAGGRTIAESEESAVVFGMPAELIKRRSASVTLHCDRIAEQLIAWAH
jgi:two-component system chemotaxis response regulator CheB